MVGAVVADFQMQPVLNDEYGEFERKLQVAAKQKKSVKLLDNNIKNNILKPGTVGAVKNERFLKIAVRAMQTLSPPPNSLLRYATNDLRSSNSSPISLGRRHSIRPTVSPRKNSRQSSLRYSKNTNSIR